MSDLSSPSWFSRNWKRVVVAGGAGILLLGGGGVAAITSIMKSSGGYAEAIQRAKTDCAVQKALGKPLEPGWFVSGSVNVSGTSGQSQLSVPIKGTRSAGTLYLEAEKVAGAWEFRMLQLDVDGQADNIDLLADSRQQCGA